MKDSCYFYIVMVPTYKHHEHYTFAQRTFYDLKKANRFADRYGGSIVRVKTYKDCSIRVQTIKSKGEQKA